MLIYDAKDQTIKFADMLEIITAGPHHAALLADIGAKSFVESHGHSSPPEDLESYVRKKFSPEQFSRELGEADSIFKIAYYNGQPAAYSKIIPDTGNPNIAETNVCKMERLYVLKEFYGLKIGKALLDLNINLAKELNQAGIWLFVWTENERALNFYKKENFKIIGETWFKISERHSNPNYWMYREI